MIHGPFRLDEKPMPGGWTLVAEEQLRPDHSVLWDVRLARGDVRIPLGPNLHRDPKPEMERLERVVSDPPR